MTIMQQDHTGMLSATAGVPDELDCAAVLDDEFMVQSYKVETCMLTHPHGWKVCPYVHPGEPVKRRHPSTHRGDMCPAVKKGLHCQVGPEACPWAHNSFELWLHPSRYKTKMCRSGAACSRGICFFAHSPDELRQRLPSTTGVTLLPPQARQAAGTPPASVTPPPGMLTSAPNLMMSSASATSFGTSAMTTYEAMQPRSVMQQHVGSAGSHVVAAAPVDQMRFMLPHVSVAPAVVDHRPGLSQAAPAAYVLPSATQQQQAPGQQQLVMLQQQYEQMRQQHELELQQLQDAMIKLQFAQQQQHNHMSMPVASQPPWQVVVPKGAAVTAQPASAAASAATTCSTMGAPVSLTTAAMARSMPMQCNAVAVPTSAPCTAAQQGNMSLPFMQMLARNTGVGVTNGGSSSTSSRSESPMVGGGRCSTTGSSSSNERLPQLTVSEASMSWPLVGVQYI